MSANKKFDPSVYEEWARLYYDGVTAKEIARTWGVSDTTVFYHLRKLNVKTRDNHAAHLAKPELVHVEMDENAKQVVLGSVLGDGALIQQKVYAFLQISHAEEQREYLEMKASYLGEFIAPAGVYTRKSPRGHGRQDIVETRTVPTAYLKELRDKSYLPNGKRSAAEIIPQLGPLGLAILWGDDGSYGKVSGKYEYGILSTCAYSFEDNELLVRFLYDKYAIKSSLLKKRVRDKVYPQIRISKEGMADLREVIKDYLPPSMQYKIGG